MEKEDLNSNTSNNIDKGKIHFVLSNSYTIFLFAVILGVIFDMVLPLKIFEGVTFEYIGLITIFISSMLVYWAQSTSKSTKIKYKEGFDHGPYKYLRNPTHLGIFMMTLGFAFIINSPFSIFFTIIAYIITKFIFLKKEEKILEERYGKDYLDYKNKIKSHL